MPFALKDAAPMRIISVSPFVNWETRNIDTQKTLNMEQVLTLIEASRETPIHMQVLFAVLLGLRRCEINGVKYSDIDYMRKKSSP